MDNLSETEDDLENISNSYENENNEYSSFNSKKSSENNFFEINSNFSGIKSDGDSIHKMYKESQVNLKDNSIPKLNMEKIYNIDTLREKKMEKNKHKNYSHSVGK